MAAVLAALALAGGAAASTRVAGERELGEDDWWSPMSFRGPAYLSYDVDVLAQGINSTGLFSVVVVDSKSADAIEEGDWRGARYYPSLSCMDASKCSKNDAAINLGGRFHVFLNNRNGTISLAYEIESRPQTISALYLLMLLLIPAACCAFLGYRYFAPAPTSPGAVYYQLANGDLVPTNLTRPDYGTMGYGSVQGYQAQFQPQTVQPPVDAPRFDPQATYAAVPVPSTKQPPE